MSVINSKPHILIQIWTTIQKLVQYNIKIIFGNKFLYFMLAALVFFIIIVTTQT